MMDGKQSAIVFELETIDDFKALIALQMLIVWLKTNISLEVVIIGQQKASVFETD
jgi:hypothetical protein